MNDVDGEDRKDDLVFEYELDAPPKRVWRAIRISEFRQEWLPDGALADPDPISSVPEREVSYRMVDDEPPFFESVVTFQIGPGADDGTLLRIVHRLTDARAQSAFGQAANDNGTCLMRAA